MDVEVEETEKGQSTGCFAGIVATFSETFVETELGLLGLLGLGLELEAGVGRVGLELGIGGFGLQIGTGSSPALAAASA